MSVPSLALGVHGRLAAHADVGDHDCYSVFCALSAILGGASDDGTAGGLWGMNDAGGPWFDRSLCGWFQVDPADRPLPVEALTDAAARTLSRFGLLDIEGLEYYAPATAPSAVRRLRNGQAWFALAPPAERARVRVTLDAGDSASLVEHRNALVRALNGLAPSEEGLDVRASDEPVEFATPVPWRWWLGNGRPHTMTIGVTATEWSPLGLGRVAALVVEACRTAGLTDAIGLRLARA